MVNCNAFKIQKAEKGKKEYFILLSPDGNLVLCFRNLINDTGVTVEEGSRWHHHSFLMCSAEGTIQKVISKSHSKIAYVCSWNTIFQECFETTPRREPAGKRNENITVNCLESFEGSVSNRAFTFKS